MVHTCDSSLGGQRVCVKFGCGPAVCGFEPMLLALFLFFYLKKIQKYMPNREILKNGR